MIFSFIFSCEIQTMRLRTERRKAKFSYDMSGLQTQLLVAALIVATQARPAQATS